jgi:hypothetical protein
MIPVIVIPIEIFLLLSSHSAAERSSPVSVRTGFVAFEDPSAALRDDRKNYLERLYKANALGCIISIVIPQAGWKWKEAQAIKAAADLAL